MDGAAGKPHKIAAGTTVTDICLHPTKEVIAVGDIEGKVKIYSYGAGEAARELVCTAHHRKAVRALCITQDGQNMFSGSKDKSFCKVDLDTGSVVVNKANAHSAAIYSMATVDENVVVTGDEDGVICMWDMRHMPDPVMKLSENDDFISDFAIDEEKKILLATSGDGTLTAVHLKKRKMELQSELFDSDLLSIAIAKDQTKVICGTGEGVLQIFNWGEWGNISDRLTGHPMSVDCLIKVNEDILCSGSMDGKVRLVHLLPNRIICTIGSHGDFPIESLSLSCDKRYIASCTHDDTVQFWRVPDVDSIEVDASKKKPKTKKTTNDNKDFFGDL